VAELIDQTISINITEQTYLDLGTWLSAEADYSQEQLTRLQREESYLPLISLANEYWLTGPLANQLQKAEFWLVLPVQLRSYLLELEKLYLQRSLAMQQETMFACDILLQANIKVVILKGAASLFNGVLKPISNRFMSDIDLLVADEKQSACEQLLKLQGYYPQPDDFDLEAHGHHHAPPLIRDNAICYVELHRRALKKSISTVLQADEIWQHAIPLSLSENVHVLQLHPTHQIILSIAHSELQDSGYSDKHLDLRQLLNLQFISTCFHEQIDWQTVQQHFYRAKQSHVLTAMLYKAYRLLNLLTPITDIYDSHGKEHFEASLVLNTKNERNVSASKFISKKLAGYKREVIIDLYGDDGRFALLTGRLKHLRRHFQMLLARIAQKRFTGGSCKQKQSSNSYGEN
jgi:hypothetical protein